VGSFSFVAVKLCLVIVLMCEKVFQYTFKIPNTDKTWTVMWDYNIGLVRTTHLFKCNEYSKVSSLYSVLYCSGLTFDFADNSGQNAQCQPRPS
jgi:hypothetical protein